MSALLLIDQLLNHIVKVDDNGFVLLNDILHLLLLLFLLLLQSLDLALLPLHNATVKTQLHALFSLLDLDVRIAKLQQK